jgi:hypothetical protein
MFRSKYDEPQHFGTLCGVQLISNELELCKILWVPYAGQESQMGLFWEFWATHARAQFPFWVLGPYLTQK